MSVQIGAQDVFAIEYALEPVATLEHQRWLYGHVCFWVGGTMVGDYAGQAALTAAVPLCRRLLTHRGNRYDRELWSLPTSEAFDRVYSALYVDSGQSDEEVARASEYFARFEALPGIDVFDGWMGFLIECETEGRFLVRQPINEIVEARVPAGEFDRVLDEFVRALQAEDDSRIGHGERG